MSTEIQPTMAKAYVFGNGMVIAFDQFGQQMPDYQGRFEDVCHKIAMDFPHIKIRAGEMVPMAEITNHLIGEESCG